MSNVASNVGLAIEKESSEPSVSSRALAKGLEILDHLGAADEPLSLGEIAAATRLGKPSTLRLLQTLASLQYVQKDADGNYRRGIRMPGSDTQSWTERLLSTAMTEMTRLNHDLAETVTLAAMVGDHIRVIHTLESSHQIRMSNYPNRILPPYASSLGKAIASFQDPNHTQLLIQVFGLYQITDKTVTEPLLIREDLQRTRERGYAVEFEETVVGGCCFGAPIVEHDGLVRSGISLSLPRTRLTPQLEEAIPKRVMEAANRIGKKLRR